MNEKTEAAARTTERKAAREAERAAVCREEFRIKTLPRADLFKQLRRHCAGFAGAVLCFDAGKELCEVYADGSPMLRAKALAVAVANGDRARKLHDVGMLGNPNLNAAYRVKCKPVDFCIRTIPENTSVLGRLIAEIESRGFASYLVAIDASGEIHFGGNNCGLFATTLADKIKDFVDAEIKQKTLDSEAEYEDA